MDKLTLSKRCNVMRKIVLFLFIGLFPLLLFAQQSGSNITTDIQVSATVIQSIELITVNAIRPGKLQPGQKEIDISPLYDASAGYMIALGTPGADFRLSFERERELYRTDGDGLIHFIYQVSGNDEENQAGSSLFLTENQNLKFNDDGRYYLWIGGNINLENAMPGNYHGDFTLEIDYI